MPNFKCNENDHIFDSNGRCATCGYDVMMETSQRETNYSTFTDNQLWMVKKILFSMWEEVESGRWDARSYVGDMALRLRDAVFGQDEETFFKEYDSSKK